MSQNHPLPTPTYEDGRTKQSFKDETDINKILARAQITGTISHLSKHEGTYSDFSDFDFFETQLKLSKGREVFDDLPSELRREFNQSPAEFFEFVNDPANKDRLAKILPKLAEPGRTHVNIRGLQTADEEAARAAAAGPPEAENEGTPGIDEALIVPPAASEPPSS